MGIDANAIEDAFELLPGAAEAMIEGRGEYVLWQHQCVGERRAQADNAMGMDPTGTTWKVDDRYVRAAKQDMLFYAQFRPIQGDRLARLRGAPKTPQAAREAEAVSYYTVLSTNERRTGSGQVAYVEIEVEPDRSGQH